MQTTGNLYTDLSGWYDQFCLQVDYAEQCAFANRVFSTFSSSGGREYLDLACGTGAHLLHMQQYGFALTGLDNSARMLELAAVKVPSAEFLLCDLAAFDVPAHFDLITCFLYSIHYSHPLSAFEQTLNQAWKSLKPGGVFIFNAVDAAGARQAHTVTTELHDDDTHMRFESGWHYRGHGDVLDLRLAITRTTTAGVERWHDQHRMTAISLPHLQDLLVQTGFEVILLEHDYLLLQPWGGDSFNVIVVACKSV
jgi:SAM-dependent methyltransferase